MRAETNKDAHNESAHLACEAAGSIRTVASLTREADCLRLYSEALERPLRQSNKTSLYAHAFYALSQSTVFFVVALVFWYGAVMVANFEANTFEFFVGLMVREVKFTKIPMLTISSTQSTTFGAIQAGNMFQFVPDMSSGKGAATELVRLFDAEPKIDADSTSGKVLDAEKVQGHLKLNHVRFRYPTRPGVRVLRDLSLEVKPGTYVALVGASGSGKSTV